MWFWQISKFDDSNDFRLILWFLGTSFEIFPRVLFSRSFSVTNSPLINISSHNSIGKFVSVFCHAENLNLFCSEPSSNDVFNCTQIDWEKLRLYDWLWDLSLQYLNCCLTLGKLLQIIAVSMIHTHVGLPLHHCFCRYDSINVFKLW